MKANYLDLNSPQKKPFILVAKILGDRRFSFVFGKIENKITCFWTLLTLRALFSVYNSYCCKVKIYREGRCLDFVKYRCYLTDFIFDCLFDHCDLPLFFRGLFNTLGRPFVQPPCNGLHGSLKIFIRSNDFDKNFTKWCQLNTPLITKIALKKK